MQLINEQSLAVIARVVQSDARAFALAHATAYKLYLQERDDRMTVSKKAGRYINVVLVTPNGKPQQAMLPVETIEATQDYLSQTVGYHLDFIHNIAFGLHAITNSNAECYEVANRALYATAHHVELGIFSEALEPVTKAGEVIRVFYGDFIVIARTMDEEGNCTTRSMTEQEVALVQEMFADPASGRLEVLRKELGEIVA